MDRNEFFNNEKEIKELSFKELLEMYEMELTVFEKIELETSGVRQSEVEQIKVEAGTKLTEVEELDSTNEESETLLLLL